MSVSNHPRPPSKRAPLGDATSRVSNTRTNKPRALDKLSPTMIQQENIQYIDQLPLSNKTQTYSAHDHQVILDSPDTNVPNKRLSAISKANEVNKSNRNSQISTTSTNASDGKGRRKTHIGPWHLGKTLGKGATARVRMARHAVTGLPAAIKIVQKKNAQISQAGSLASLDRKDVEFKEGDGVRRMPYGIEREVAIMKLIEHPHIMQLYDIWENRTEIYLVLEFVDNGELFDHISRCGLLPEEEALKYFRQLLSAVGYCHQFNICHRDLKPENILLTRDGDIKIADFGMAAIQQSPEHRLVTSCGSPHYAAPEVIKAVPYKGDKVDIWSMGVILYATLSGRLPFDNPSLPRLLASIQKGHFRMASAFSPDAADLIRRMLQIDPRDRISLSQIWRHPLLRKYDHIDNFRGAPNPRSLSLRHFERPVLRRSDIDTELLRHLKSLWHQFEEQQIINLLLNDESNDQKLFYSLLLKHRETQLENYTPDVGHSNSDYHHVRPLSQVKKLSTRQFSQPSSSGHRRQVSRFTVVSNSGQSNLMRKGSGYADTEVADTIKSYDPFKASRPQNLTAHGSVAQANIIIHRNPATRLQEEKYFSRNGAGSFASSKRSRKQSSLIAPPRAYASRSSLASSTRSRGSNTQARIGLGHKRGVSFTRARRQPNRTASDGDAIDRTRARSKLVEDEYPTERAVSHSPDAFPYIRSRKAPAMGSQVFFPGQRPDGATHLFQDDVRQLSSNLAKDCDEAFNRTSDLSTVPSSLDNRSGHRYSTPFSSFDQGDVSTERLPMHQPKSGASKPKILMAPSSYDSRPLPAPPARSESVNEELAEALKNVESRKFAGDAAHSPRYIERMATHIDRLMQPNQALYNDGDRRVVSAPAGAKTTKPSTPLASLDNFSENREPDDYEQYIRRERAKDGRVGSAPATMKRNMDIRVVDEDRRERFTARAVPPSSSPAKSPAPLNIRKVSQTSGAVGQSNGLLPASDLRHQSSNASSGTYRPDSGYAEDLFKYDHVDDGLKKKKPNWFKRTSKPVDEKRLDRVRAIEDRPANIPGVRAPESKKKNFGLSNLFKKRGTKEDDDLAVGSFELYEDDTGSVTERLSYQPGAHRSNSTARQIEPRQNWLARLFNVKPAKIFMCFNLSRRRARQEVAFLLKDWRQYGIKDIVVDKQRNIVFGKIGAKNYLQLKEVSFACEIMTVIEHGKRSHLSIARFTQETGAASSFHKVVETMETVFKTRGLLVGDERKRRMMVKTLTGV